VICKFENAISSVIPEKSKQNMIFSSLVLKKTFITNCEKNIFLTGCEKNVLKLVKKYQVAVVIPTKQRK
jgi:hypothetical protein